MLLIKVMIEKKECLEILDEGLLWDGNVEYLFDPQNGTRPPFWGF